MGWLSGFPDAKTLERPEPLQEVLKMDKDDCLTCRLTGSAAFVGLGAYSYLSGHHQLQLQKAKILSTKSLLGFKGRQRGITGISATLVLMGIWRLIN